MAHGERSYSSYLFMISALDGVSGQRHAPAMLYPRERNPGNSSQLRLKLYHSSTLVGFP
jgi:hypothetical protein